MWEQGKIIITFFFLDMNAIHISDVRELSQETLKKKKITLQNYITTQNSLPQENINYSTKHISNLN
jgi:hypothetical protein